MIKNINVSPNLNSDLLVNEPLRLVNEKISTLPSQKVILTGGRGCGKSTVLRKRQEDTLYTDKPAVLTVFDSKKVFDNRTIRKLGGDYLEHYYELAMCSKFLRYIKENYPEAYKKNLKDLDEFVAVNFIDVQRCIKFGDSPKDGRTLFPGEVLSEILYHFRANSGIKDFELMIDRFDWTDESKDVAQDVLRRYFTMFGKVIITSDDESITSGRRVSNLASKNYTLMDVDYGWDPEIVSEIAEKKFAGVDLLIPLECLTLQNYELLIEACNGDIAMMMEVIKGAEDSFDGKRSLAKQVDLVAKNKSKQKIKSTAKLHL